MFTAIRFVISTAQAKSALSARPQEGKRSANPVLAKRSSMV
jgi:hypothetical protein